MRACRKRPLPPVLPLLLPLVLLLPAPPPKLIAVCLRGGGLSSVGVGPERWDGMSSPFSFTILSARAGQDKASQVSFILYAGFEDGLSFRKFPVLIPAIGISR